MSTADKSYNSGFSIKFPLILDNFSDIRQLDIFDSKLTVWEDYIVGIQLLITAVAAFILNVFVIIVCVKKRNSLVPADYFIVNLAACDLILSFVGLPFGITSSFFHRWKFGSGGCKAYGCLGFFCGVVSISTLALMSFSRYVHVCKNSKSSSLSKYTKFFIIGSYVYACLWASLPLLGWGEYGVEPYGTSCTLKWTSDKEFVTLMLISCIILPVFVMKYCYGGVYLYLRRHCKKFRTDRSKTGNNIRKREEYLIKMAFMMCCAFMLTWTPYAVVSFWAAYGEPKSIPVRLTLASVLIAKTSTIWNPLIYFVLNKKFKPHIRLCLRTFFRCETNAQQRRARSPWHFCNSGSSMTSSL
ncbi:visual pigment-like receptor peropsin [Crassostrea virginica]|uniref:Opsin-5-like n=1 Tax=Crassostrea virginica TaxID=6565 RepID=A0A8B8F1H5_CRAVI|nr:opsin-5-like [Crassostrea virginica]